MKRYVVDTNVPIVANGRPSAGERKPTIECRMAAVQFLDELLKDGVVLMDAAGEIQMQYRKHLKPSGQPGVGDRFYQEVLLSSPKRVERIVLDIGEDGEYVDLPAPIVTAGFDPSDRKFAAIACKESVPVVNAVDSDWLEFREVLENEGIRIKFICGCNYEEWFAD